MQRSLIAAIKHAFRPQAVEDAFDDGSTPSVGTIDAFRTSPFSEFAPPTPGRHAALKVIGMSDKVVAVAVLDGIWRSTPTFKEADKAPILCEHRFAHTGRPAVFGVYRDWWRPSDLDGLKSLGKSRVSPEESSLAANTTGFGVGSRSAALRWANFAAEGEWRWTHDREALVAESRQVEARNKATREAEEERYRNRLVKLTWEQLLAETPFERWASSPPFPPADFTTAARGVIRDACKTLEALGPKPKKAAVRAVLKHCVEWFNIADEKAGGVIDTEEREDIYVVLEEMAFVARQKQLVDEIDVWREW